MKDLVPIIVVLFGLITYAITGESLDAAVMMAGLILLLSK